MRVQLISDYRMEHLALTISERSSVEWDSRTRRLSPFLELITWVDVTLIGAGLMGELQHFLGSEEADMQTLGCQPHAILEPIFQASIEGYLEAT
jgi:hypothetical protein